MGLLKLIRDYRAPVDAAAALDLRRQLGQLEQNVSGMGDAIVLAAMQRLQVKATEESGDALTVAPGQSLGIVSTVARVQLAAPRPADAGKFLAICKGAGAASNTDLLAPSGSSINGATLFTVTASGVLQLVYCDGVNYWTGP